MSKTKNKKKQEEVRDNSGLPGVGKSVQHFSISKGVDEIPEPRKGKFKRSGHLADQMLKYTYPKDSQPTLFDNLLPETIKDIETTGVEVTQIVEGIKLSSSEQKVIDSLCKLLHENSQNIEPGKEDYYTGNRGFDLVPYDSNGKSQAPRMAFTLYELTQEYTGDKEVSGEEVNNVRKILNRLDEKKFLLSYVETTKTKRGERLERKIEAFRKLIDVQKITETKFTKNNVEISKKEETIVLLNPIFRSQIDSKFILYPDDITKRTIIAYGSPKVSEIALNLREYLARERSSGRLKPEIYLERLYYILAEKWMRQSRKKKVREYTEKALETCINLGLLEKYEIKAGKTTGEPKIIFHLNKDWE